MEKTKMAIPEIKLDLVMKKKPTVSESDLKTVVIRQKRHKISNEHCVDFGEWQAWEECGIDDYNDVRSLIEAGYNYEVRELVVAS